MKASCKVFINEMYIMLQIFSVDFIIYAHAFNFESIRTTIAYTRHETNLSSQK